MRNELIKAVEEITAQIAGQQKLYEEATERDDIFEVKKEILSAIREPEQKLSAMKQETAKGN